ncbi:unnamed protein product [Brachionus calyciflorus]|uniref:Uncharacterized protein n=1 Tax=Brachionus calyciflorus TaxID=104777 RepID=A0A813W4P1_9BILA|nr:unnamed protein product [Brachionus calyciflorus]
MEKLYLDSNLSECPILVNQLDAVLDKLNLLDSELNRIHKCRRVLSDSPNVQEIVEDVLTSENLVKDQVIQDEIEDEPEFITKSVGFETYQKVLGYLEQFSTIKTEDLRLKRGYSSSINNQQELIYNYKRTFRACNDPDTKELDEMYSKYVIEFLKLEEIQLKKSLGDVHNDTADFDFEKSAYFENTQCNEHIRNRTLINQQSLCPWRNKIIHRDDRYPRYKSIAKCTCENCATKSQSFFNCMPVFRTAPVLIRKKCLSNGTNEWIPGLEKISFACVCAFRHKYIPHRI